MHIKRRKRWAGAIALIAGVLISSSLTATAASAAAVSGPGTYEETSSEISYSGSWTRMASTGSSGGAIRYASGSASASLTFDGPDITWYSWNSPSAGIVKVYLDGSLVDTIDNYAPSLVTRVRAFTKLGLPAGTHTIKVAASGSKNSASTAAITHFDSFVVGKDRDSDGGPQPADAESVSYAACPSATTTVSTNVELTAALAKAVPGSVIRLQPGSYTGGFTLESSGTSTRPIWICGPRSAVVKAKSASSGVALRLSHAENVRIAGFSITGALQGVMVKFGKNVAISDLSISDTGYEGVHLYAFTTDSYVLNNEIQRTGAVDVAYGEGVYIGTSQRRWDEVTDGAPDRSDRNIVAGNTITLAGAEPIEAKEGTSSGMIANNTIVDHRAASRAIGWVLVTGSYWSVLDNTGSDAVTNGYATMAWNGWGTGNVFRGNTGDVGSSGWGISVQDPNVDVAVACDNWPTGAAKGVTNVFCVP